MTSTILFSGIIIFINQATRINMNHPRQCSLVVITNNISELMHCNETLFDIRKRNPSDKIITIVPKSSLVVPILKSNPNIDEVILIEGDSPLYKLPKKSILDILSNTKIDKIYIVFRGSGNAENVRIVQSSIRYPGKVYLWRVLKSPQLLYSPAGILRYLTNGKKMLSIICMDNIQNFAYKIIRKDNENIRNINPKRILWMPMDGLGDLVITLPALIATQNRYPNAKIDVLIREAYEELYKDLDINVQTIPFELPNTPARSRPPANSYDIIKLIAQLRRCKYDLSIDLGGLDVYRKIAFWSRIKIRVGAQRSNGEDIGRNNWSGLLTTPVAYTNPHIHTYDLAFNILSKLGINDIGTDVYKDILLTSRSKEIADCMLKEYNVNHNYAIIQAFSVVEAKLWRNEGFIDVINHLVSKYDYDIILTGSKGDSEANDRLRSLSQDSDRIHNISGKIPISALGYLYHKARIMVTLDTGPMHLAAAVGTPMVALFMPGDHYRFYPYGQSDAMITPDIDELRKAFCENMGKYNDILDTVGIERVIEKIDTIITQRYANV